MAGVLSGIFGSKPDVPTLPSLDLATEQKKAVSGNLGVLPEAQGLVSKTNLFNIDQINKMLAQAIPGYGDITGNVAKNIQSLTAGEIPQDVQEAVTRGAAGRALSGGYGGTQAGNNLVARDLGLTSLGLTQQGLSSAESWMKTMDSLYAPGMLNLSSMFVSPMQQAGFDVTERNAQFERSWLSSQIESMPDPVLSGINAEIMQLLNSYVGSLGGGGMKGGGGGGGGGGMAGYTESFQGYGADLAPYNYQNPSFSGD